MEGIATASEVDTTMGTTNGNTQVSIAGTLTSIRTRLTTQREEIDVAINEVDHLMSVFGIAPENVRVTPKRRVVTGTTTTTKRRPVKVGAKKSTRKTTKKKTVRKRKPGPLTERETEAVAIFKKHTGKFVDPEVIGKAMKIEPRSVSSLVHGLKVKGIKIESAKSVRNAGGKIPESASGYRLVGNTSKS